MQCLIWISFALCLFTIHGGSNAYAFGSKKSDANKVETQPTSAATDSLVWVSRSDGSTSCGDKKGQPLESGAGELEQSGVKVLSSRKGNDGKMHAMSCGMPTGATNVYQISREDLPKALGLGFKEETRL
jgi:hypothetical protein